MVRITLFPQRGSGNVIECNTRFSRSGSFKKIGILVEALQEEFHGVGSVVKLDSQDVHCVAGALKRILMKIEPPLIPLETIQLLQDAQFGAHPAPPPIIQERIRLFKEALGRVTGPRSGLISHMLLFMRRVAGEAKHNRMNAANVCRVFSASLLRLPDDLQSALYLASGRLPAVALTLLISDVLLPSSWNPSTGAPLEPDSLGEVLTREEAALSDSMCPPEPAVEEAGTGTGEYCMVDRAAARPVERPRPQGWDEVCDGSEAERDGVEGWLGGLEPLTRWLPRWSGGGLTFPWPPQH